MQNGAETMENSMWFPQKIKNWITMWATNPTYDITEKLKLGFQGG